MSEPSGVQYGGFWIRFIALLADSAIVFLVTAALLVGAAMALPPEDLTPLVLALTVLGILYWPLMHASRRQATFGKAIVGLKVSRLDGRRISILRSLWREIAKLFSGAVLMLGYLMAAFTPRKQGLHDLMAATYVVREGPAHVIPALAVAVAGFVLPVLAGPMIVGAAMLDAMTKMAQDAVPGFDPMQLAGVPAPQPKAPAKPQAPAAKPPVAAPKPPAPVVQAAAPEPAKPVVEPVKAVEPAKVVEPVQVKVAPAAPKVEAPKIAEAKPKVAQVAQKPKPAPKTTQAGAQKRPSPAVQSAELKRSSGPKYNDLMTAVLYSDVESVNELLKLGKWVDKPDSRGVTPLMAAAELGDMKTAEALLRGGANARLAVPVAEERRNGEMVQLLKRYAGR